VNNEQFMTSVLPHMVENTQRRHSGVCIHLIVLYWKLCKPYNHNPLNAVLVYLLSVSCWKADVCFKSLHCFNFLKTSATTNFCVSATANECRTKLSQRAAFGMPPPLSVCKRMILSRQWWTGSCLLAHRPEDSHHKNIASLSFWAVASENQN